MMKNTTLLWELCEGREAKVWEEVVQKVGLGTDTASHRDNNALVG